MTDMEAAREAMIEYLMKRTGSAQYFKRIDIDKGHHVQLTATHIAGAAIQANVPVKPDLVDFAMQFWSGSDRWLRIDNQVHDGHLHFHLPSGSQPENWHIPLDGEYTILGLVRECFRRADEVKAWKYPR